MGSVWGNGYTFGLTHLQNNRCTRIFIAAFVTAKDKKTLMEREKPSMNRDKPHPCHGVLPQAHANTITCENTGGDSRE